jgi:hypothetical protein
MEEGELPLLFLVLVNIMIIFDLLVLIQFIQDLPHGRQTPPRHVILAITAGLVL